MRVQSVTGVELKPAELDQASLSVKRSVKLTLLVGEDDADAVRAFVEAYLAGAFVHVKVEAIADSDGDTGG